MRIENIEFPTRLFLAPMMDITTPSFRQLIVEQGGVGLVVTPMIFVQQISEAPKTVIPHFELLEKQHPIAVQIVSNGKNIEQLRNAIEFVNTFNFDMIDINAGCPAPHTLRSGGGGKLLKEPERLLEIVKTTIKYSNVPVSVKTRLGFESINEIVELAPKIEQEGAVLLTIHGRTVRQKYRDSAILEPISKVKEKLNIPVIGNGDVRNYDDLERMITLTKCDGVMIGRGATFDPAIFRRLYEKMNKEKIFDKLKKENTTKIIGDNLISENIQGTDDRISMENVNKNINKIDNEPLPPHDLSEIRIYLKELDNIINSLSKFWNNPRFKLAEMRRLSIWFIKGLPGYKTARMKLSRFNNIDDLKEYMFGKGIEKDLKSSI